MNFLDIFIGREITKRESKEECNSLIKEYNYYNTIFESIENKLIMYIVDGIELEIIDDDDNILVSSILADSNFKFDPDFYTLSETIIRSKYLFKIKIRSKNKSANNGDITRYFETEEGVRQLLREHMQNGHRINVKNKEFFLNSVEERMLKETMKCAKTMETNDSIKIYFTVKGETLEERNRETIFIERDDKGRFYIDSSNEIFNERELMILLIWIINGTRGECSVTLTVPEKTIDIRESI